MDPVPKPQELAPQERNLLTHQDETIRSLMQMEATLYPEWAERQSAEHADVEHNSIANALAWLQGSYAGAGKGHFVIYGALGVNRWYVYPDGAVVFFLDVNHKAGTVADAQRARELGFRVESSLRRS